MYKLCMKLFQVKPTLNWKHLIQITILLTVKVDGGWSNMLKIFNT